MRLALCETLIMNYTILLTFDVEDWFQVENFKQCIPFSSWPNYELRVEKNVHRILDLLDSINCNTPVPQHRSTAPPQHRSNAPTHHCSTAVPQNFTQHFLSSSPPASRLAPHVLNSLPCAMRHAPCEKVRGTFFILGWLAERLPHLVREIQERGHEIASHGYDHELCGEQSTEDLKDDLVKSKKLLEDITGNPVYGYRAPSFSISDDILQLIRQTGYLYDSSFNSFALHRRYGRMKLNGNGGNGILHTVSDNFYELPVSNLKLVNRILPWGGGGYFRLIPTRLFKYGVQSILKNQGAYLFYLHPWEIDSDQPKVAGVQLSYKFRHYINLNKTLKKLSYLLTELRDCRFQTCYEYLTDRNHSTAAPLHFFNS